jgi:ubiquinol-cytochrome c reductase cytochrome b subunit
LREVGSNNPDGIEIKKNKGPDGIPVDGIPFHPYYTIKDIFGVAVFLTVFVIIVFYFPELYIYFLEPANFVPADSLKTPEHIAPLWYFTPYYAILRAVPPLFGSQFPGVLVMGLAVMILFVLPWLDRGPVKSIRYRSAQYKILLAIFVISFVGLGYLGMLPPDPVKQVLAQIFSVGYFGFFIGLFFISKNEKCKQPPERVNYK